MTPTRRIAVLTAGLGRPSSTRLLADRLVESVVEHVGARDEDAQVQVIELRDLAHDITNNMLTGFPAGELRQAIDTVLDSDAVIAVTPVFTASYSGLFKSFFDVLDPDALAGKPVLIGATAGTARHSLVLEHALRPMFAYLRAVVVPTAVFAATEDFGGAGGGMDHGLADRIERAAQELATLVAGAGAGAGAGAASPGPASTEDRPARVQRRSTTDKDFEVITPFEQLLGDQLG